MLRTILVVEDEPSLADILRLMLEMAGYAVAVAGDGRAALGRLAEARYDLVLSDMMMPLLDGAGLAAAMHADPALRAIPLILMSALHRSPDGAVPHAAFLRKPFDYERLLATVARVLGQEAEEQERR
jgi:CheY-like chemotaxis protein